jgi:hypothetical protein
MMINKILILKILNYLVRENQAKKANKNNLKNQNSQIFCIPKRFKKRILFNLVKFKSFLKMKKLIINPIQLNLEEHN